MLLIEVGEVEYLRKRERNVRERMTVERRAEQTDLDDEGQNRDEDVRRVCEAGEGVDAVEAQRVVARGRDEP
jgi:hypothetical protein